jgi:hypothetical protein
MGGMADLNAGREKTHLTEVLSNEKQGPVSGYSGSLMA